CSHSWSTTVECKINESECNTQETPRPATLLPIPSCFKVAPCRSRRVRYDPMVDDTVVDNQSYAREFRMMRRKIGSQN
ncbi:hypothetical protein PSHT_00423, partial [Puccinia striiformis]